MPPVRSRSGRLRRSLPGEDSVGGILPLFFHAGSASGLFAPQRRRTSPAGSGFRSVRAGSVRQPALRAVRCRGGRGAEVRTRLRKNGERSFVEAGSVGGIRISFPLRHTLQAIISAAETAGKPCPAAKRTISGSGRGALLRALNRFGWSMPVGCRCRRIRPFSGLPPRRDSAASRISMRLFAASRG